MRTPDYRGEHVVFLSTPTGPRFAYDPVTGIEIANNLARYGVTDRATILETAKSALRLDSLYLRGKGVGTAAQDRFIEKL